MGCVGRSSVIMWGTGTGCPRDFPAVPIDIGAEIYLIRVSISGHVVVTGTWIGILWDPKWIV